VLGTEKNMSPHAKLAMEKKPAIDKHQYGQVLSRELPRAIRNDRDLKQAIARLEDLDSRHASLTAEEREVAELYTALIEAYEDQHYPVPRVAPNKLLQALLEQRGLAQADIAQLLGGRGHASEIVRGKRSISKAQAKKLAEFFKVSADLFI
jgi:HTH-type transcriptional regulator / antitoxin HigA